MKQFTLEEKNAVLETPFTYIHRKLDILLSVGQLLMECGADTKRITDEMLKSATFLGIPQEYLNIHISYTTLMINLRHHDATLTVFRKTPKHEPNMAMVGAVSKLTWRALERHYSLTTYERLLNKLPDSVSSYPNWVKGVFSALGCSGLAILFGGEIIAAVMTFICSLLGYFTRAFCMKIGFDSYVSIACGAFTAMGSAYLSYSFIDQTALLYTLVCCTLFMIPGVPLINSVIDTINNHILSGVTRGIRTILIVSAMTLGMAMALHFSPVPSFAYVDIKPHLITIEQIIGSFMAAASFAVLFNVPYRVLVYIGIGGVICVSVRNMLLVDFAFAIPGATFVGATVMSIIFMRLSPLLRTSGPVLIVPSAIALMPGVLLYRFLFDILHIGNLNEAGLLHTIQNGVTGVLTIIAIAVGVAIPNVLAQRYLDTRKQARLEELLRSRHEFEEKKKYEIINASKNKDTAGHIIDKLINPDIID